MLKLSGWSSHVQQTSTVLLNMCSN